MQKNLHFLNWTKPKLLLWKVQMINRRKKLRKPTKMKPRKLLITKPSRLRTSLKVIKMNSLTRIIKFNNKVKSWPKQMLSRWLKIKLLLKWELLRRMVRNSVSKLLPRWLIAKRIWQKSRVKLKLSSLRKNWKEPLIKCLLSSSISAKFITKSLSLSLNWSNSSKKAKTPTKSMSKKIKKYSFPRISTSARALKAVSQHLKSQLCKSKVKWTNYWTISKTLRQN